MARIPTWHSSTWWSHWPTARLMLPCLLAVSHCCGCYYVKCSAQCSPPAAIGRGEMDYRLARSDVILGTPPATMRIKFGINAFTPNSSELAQGWISLQCNYGIWNFKTWMGIPALPITWNKTCINVFPLWVYFLTQNEKGNISPVHRSRTLKLYLIHHHPQQQLALLLINRWENEAQKGEWACWSLNHWT